MAADEKSATDMRSVLGRNIRELVDKRKEEERARGVQERIAERVSRFIGSMAFVYLHATILLVWLTWNLGFIPGLKPWDPSFVTLAMAASVEAIFLSTFVLITQNRMAAKDERRAELDLQISLLNEHETTRLIEMVSALTDRFGLQTPADHEIPQLRENVSPGKVMDEIARSNEEVDRTS